MAEEALELSPNIILRIHRVCEAMRSLAIMNEAVFKLHGEGVTFFASLQISYFEVNALVLELLKLDAI